MKTCNECGRVVEVAVCGRNVTLCHGCLRKLSGDPPKAPAFKSTYYHPPFDPMKPIGRGDYTGDYTVPPMAETVIVRNGW